MYRISFVSKHLSKSKATELQLLVNIRHLKCDLFITDTLTLVLLESLTGKNLIHYFE